MKYQPIQNGTLVVALVAVILLVGMLSTQSTSMAGVFDSPLAFPSNVLTFQSPLLSPSLEFIQAPTAPGYP